MSDYKSTLNLPQTDFSMKANLSQQEPKRLAWWEENSLYAAIREQKKGKPLFVLHDGPPYANGHLHCGHALNKILKDMVIKSKTMSDYDAPFVPGWDCHGLPIELNVEKKIGKVGQKVDAASFRAACRSYAASQIDIQRDEFKRLGVFGEWSNPYATMDFSYEASVVRQLGKLIKDGLVYQGLKPVHWCIDCGSALAEAEVEYENKRSHAIDVAFRVVNKDAVFALCADLDETKPVMVPIWTTTPWTLPANEAICVNPEVMYALYDLGSEYVLLAEALSESSLSRYKHDAAVCVVTMKGESLKDWRCQHPFFDKEVPVLMGEHVTTDSGTGCVHTAPAHGVEDYAVGHQHGLPCISPVMSNGCYNKDMPLFGGISVLKANEPVIDLIKQHNLLLAHETIEHSYPHCWRHKSPMIFLTTPQWFISMDHKNLRSRLLESVNGIEFIPDWGRVRMSNMIEGRPDWCISRQRNWGTPIPVFIHRTTRELHPQTPELIEKIAKLIEQNGLEAWFEVDVKSWLGDDTEFYEKVTDTLDVWFDAGSSHAAVLRQRPELSFPADLYLEGSDQYRGWFNASLTTSVALSDEIPYKTVLTHGYTVDSEGKKLSKSAGNYIALDKIIQKYGADLIRLWAASTDYRYEVSISEEILTRLADVYRRIRNTARFLLSNLFDFDPKEHAVPAEKMLELDRYILVHAQALQDSILTDYDNYVFHSIYQKIQHFCAIDLGGFYLDIIKDRQYTTGTNSLARRSCQTAMYHILQALTRWIAPILSFTAEEIWQCMPNRHQDSVFLATWYKDWPVMQHLDMDFWKKMQIIRDEVNKALERAREQKIIGSGLAASVVIYAPDELMPIIQRLKDELRFFFITSSAQVLPKQLAPEDATYVPNFDIFLQILANEDTKCVRCWHRCGDVGDVSSHPELCKRCANTVMGADETREFV